MARSLDGLSVLIVEDEIIVGMMLCSEIVREGGSSIGPVVSIADAVTAIESRLVDAVVLDAKLVDGSGAELAAFLGQRRIPFVVVSGYERANLPTALRAAPYVAKPISLPLLMETIKGLNSPTLPRGGKYTAPR